MLWIVIPTLNESASLPRTVAAVRASAEVEPIEIVVSDCDSRDGTADVARQLGVRVVTGGRSRAEAMNLGAAACTGGPVDTGDPIQFLHADSTPPTGFPRKIRQALRDPAVVGGAFEFEFEFELADSANSNSHTRVARRLEPRERLHRILDRRLLDVIVFCNRFRYRRSRGFFGDQGIFVRRGVFHRLGGFPPVRLMEDVRFSLSLSRIGKTAILSPPVLTSPRRFLSRGIVRQFVQDMVLLNCESWGVCPQNLWGHYNDFNHGRGACRRARLSPFRDPFVKSNLPKAPRPVAAELLL